MAGLVFPNDAGQINYALCMGHNYTSTDPFQPAVPGPLTAPCLEFHIIHQHVRIFLSVSASLMYFLYLFLKCLIWREEPVTFCRLSMMMSQTR